MKEAVKKSFGKGRSQFEESAKSAAKFAGDTAKKVKKSLSQKSRDAEAEL